MKRTVPISIALVLPILITLTVFYAINPTKEPNMPAGPEYPAEAREWRALAWREENGEINENTIAAALATRDEYLSQQEATYGFSNGAAARMNWVPRGPTNVGGRTRALVIHPTDTSTMWAGSVGGGVWKTTNGGQSWFSSNGNIQNFAVSCLAIAPDNPDVLYAGTGEGFGNNDHLRGDGIYKSTDGGNTWARIPSTDPSDVNVLNRQAWYFVDRISIAHDNSDLILAATAGGIMRTEDGGNTDWTRERVGSARFVAFNPLNSDYAIAHIVEDNLHTALYYLPTRGWQVAERGQGFFQLSGGYDRIELEYAPSAPNIVYAFNPIGIDGAEVSRSEDGGQTFQITHTSQSMGGQMWYNNTVWVSPEDPDFVIVGSVELHKSTNSGIDFTQISLGHGNQYSQHADKHCIVEDPAFDGDLNNRVFVCSDGGVFVADDIEAATVNSGWASRNTGYQTGQYYGAAGDAGTDRIIGGLQDNGTQRLQMGNTSSNTIGSSDGGFAAIDPVNTGFCYGETQSVNGDIFIYRFYDGCFLGAVLPITASTEAAFIPPFAFDLNDTSGNRMFVGGRELWRTSNLRTELPTVFDQISTRTGAVSAIAIAPGNSNIVWIAEGFPSHIYKTENALNASPSPSPSFSPVDDNGTTLDPILRNTYVSKILIDNDDSDVVYVALGGFPEPSPSPVHGNLWRTDDGGENWEDISSNLPRVPIRAIARHPNDASRLYVGTEIGVYKSDNTGGSWQPVLDGPANVSVDDLSFMHASTILLAATHGRGIWTSDVDQVSAANDAPADFDGDGRTDFSVFRPSGTPTWHIFGSLAGYSNNQFGLASDVPLAGDFDADGKADITVFRPSNGTWYWINSSNSTTSYVQYGANGDVPMPGDFDKDGYSDQAVFRPSTGVWYLNRSDEGSTSIQWGISTDFPVVADFDGDERSDIGVFRLTSGIWYLHPSTDPNTSTQWGQSGDVPIAGDYDGDGEADVGVWRPGNGTWYINRSDGQGYAIYPFGESTDVPVPGDYDGDGRIDIAVFEPSSGVWGLLQSSNGLRLKQFGGSTDIPIPSYVLDRSSARGSDLRSSAPPPAGELSPERWRAPGIPQEEFVRTTFKPGSVAGLSDPETVRKVLGGRKAKATRTQKVR